MTKKPRAFIIAVFPAMDGSFGIVVPQLDGCFSGSDTIDQIHANAKEAIGLWFDGRESKRGTSETFDGRYHEEVLRDVISDGGWLDAVIVEV